MVNDQTAIRNARDIVMMIGATWIIVDQVMLPQTAGADPILIGLALALLGIPTGLAMDRKRRDGNGNGDK